MKSFVLLGVVALSLLASACASRIAHGPSRAQPVAGPAAESKAEPVKAGGFGNGDAPVKRPDAPLVSATPGTAADPHSDVASKTPDGGKSATVSDVRTALDGRIASEGADTPGVDQTTSGGSADTPSGDKRASGPGGEATAEEADSDAAAAAGAKPSGPRPVDESDPSVDPLPTPSRRRI